MILYSTLDLRSASCSLVDATKVRQVFIRPTFAHASGEVRKLGELCQSVCIRNAVIANSVSIENDDRVFALLQPLQDLANDHLLHLFIVGRQLCLKLSLQAHSRDKTMRHVYWYANVDRPTVVEHTVQASVYVCCGRSDICEYRGVGGDVFDHLMVHPAPASVELKAIKVAVELTQIHRCPKNDA